jgi:hypothetical protein
MTRGIAKGWVTMALIVSSGCTASGEQSAGACWVAVRLGCGVGVSVGKGVLVEIGLAAACWTDGTGGDTGCESGPQAAHISTITIQNILDILSAFDLKTPFWLVRVRMGLNFKINFTAV